MFCYTIADGNKDMGKAKRIFFIADSKDLTNKLLLSDLRKRSKGFVRLGHDTQIFSYNLAFRECSCFTSRRLSRLFYKSQVDGLLAERIRDYRPDIVFLNFAKFLDVETIAMARQAAPKAVFVGIDVDAWPRLHTDWVQIAKGLDIVIATNGGAFLQDYRDAGVPLCAFMPNICDPDIEYRYDVGERWQSDILFTGKVKHKHYPTEDIRPAIVSRLAKMKNCALYGCCGRHFIGGMDYYYAISGAKIGVSINATSDIRLYHSDRLTHYLACGTFVLAKYVPDSELLFKDGVHLRYFNTADEFFELANWYLQHEDERLKIANAGMGYVHHEFNCEKIARYTLDLVENGRYAAPWTT